MKMKIVIDDKIPYISGAFEGVADKVVYLPGSKTTPEIVADADAIITRTRTICNEKLLKGSTVKLIATATIGYDHIDTEYCDQAGIVWTNAPGCNSGSVQQYIASVLMVLAERKQLKLSEMCIGIVGVGNVGSKIAKLCNILGMKVLLNDPPRERIEGSSAFVSLEQIQNEADIITLHVPLNMKGEDVTFHLADRKFFDNLVKYPVLINSCRGEVVDSLAVKYAIQQGKINSFVCDCWEHEPDIDLELLQLTEIATPHIAGYSKDGKANGTQMSVKALNEFFHLGLDNWEPQGVERPDNSLIELDGSLLSESELIAVAILKTYDISLDDRNLRKNSALFEKLRGDYPVRREFHAYTLKTINVENATLVKLKALGFKYVN